MTEQFLAFLKKNELNKPKLAQFLKFKRKTEIILALRQELCSRDTNLGPH